MMRTILTFGADDQRFANCPFQRIRGYTGEGKSTEDVPTLTLYCASGEPNPPAVLKTFSKRGLIRGRIRAKNPATHGEYYFTSTLCAAAVSALVAWFKARKGRKIEIRKGDMKVSAPTSKELDAALASLSKYENLNVMLKNPELKRVRKAHPKNSAK